MKYIIISQNLIGVGGSILYIRCKVQYLKSLGYDVYVISSRRGKIIVNGLEEYEKTIIPEVKYPPFSFREKECKKILEKINECTNGVSNYTIIESSDKYSAQWGELLSEAYKCRNFFFDLAEQQFAFRNSDNMKFLKFKLDKKQLAGIGPKSLYVLFDGYYTISETENQWFAAYSKALDKELDIAMTIPFSDYNIGAVWYTAKPGFVETSKEIQKYCVAHPDTKYNYVVIGSGSKSHEKIVRNMFNCVPNVNLIMTGYQSPLPGKFLNKIDVFVSSANAARITASLKIPTVSVTSEVGDDGKLHLVPLGILYYTTRNTTIPEKTGISLSKYLDLILLEKYCDNNHIMNDIDLGSDEVIEKEFRRQLNIIYSTKEEPWYDVYSIKAHGYKEKLYYIIGHVFNAKTVVAIDYFSHEIKEIIGSIGKK